MTCAACGHPKLVHATKCTQCSCPKFKESELPSSQLFKRDADGDYDGDKDDDDDDE